MECKICKKEYPETKKYFYTNGSYMYKICKGCYCVKSLKYKNATQKYSDAWFNEQYHKKKSTCPRRGLDFNLSFGEYQELMTNPSCYYCDFVFPEDWQGQGIKSIDRIVSDKGYEKDNCVTCCFRCNNQKRASDLQRLYVRREKIEEELSNMTRIIRKIEDRKTTHANE